jgi:hypothetical protein
MMVGRVAIVSIHKNTKILFGAFKNIFHEAGAGTFIK